MARWNLCASTTFEILSLSTCTRCKQKSYISKYIQPIFEIFPSSRRYWGWAFGWKVSGAQVFYFCNGKVKTLHIDNIWNFATFNLYTVRAEILYLQRYSTNFRNLSLSSKMLRVGIWVESFRCAGILLLQLQGETWRIDNIWNFATFNVYTVPAKFLYLQRYSINFRNLCLSWKMLRVGTWVESFRRAGILPLQWQAENFAHRQHLKFCHFQPLHCARKIPISPKVFSWFSKSLPQLEDVEGGHLGGKFQLRRYFTFAMARWNFAHRQHLKFCYFQPVQCASKNLISPEIFNQFSKSLPQLEDVEGGHLGEKFQVRRHFTFAMARWKICASTTFEVLLLSTCTLCQQKSYIFPKLFNRFLKSFPQLEDVEGGNLGGKFQVRWNFTFAMAYRQHFKFSHFQPVHCASRNTLSPKIFKQFSKSFPRREHVDDGHLGGNFQVPRNFTFAMARWKLCAWTTFEILPLSTCTLCQQKSFISNGIQPIFEILASARRRWGWAFGW